jgi:large subunit ribosomal protein L19
MEKVEQAYIKKAPPEFRVGDTVSVSVRIVEGQKERTQIFTGTVISRKGRSINEMFTVRRIVNNEGVERVFPLNSPQVLSVKVIRSGHVRRSKLYYLRDRIGKSVRLRDKRRGLPSKKAKSAKSAATKS